MTKRGHQDGKEVVVVAVVETRGKFYILGVGQHANTKDLDQVCLKRLECLFQKKYLTYTL